ncbi:winged helix-turn-helix transcriptional regulator [Mucilaginibacter litoreus]|uniref:Winged helix-turn-helix transcriptional regulator n=1 Tax=Mucilaginibacter litoreus TaxID=1048221 RepID=A0ABW3AWI4_9SPHI
MYNRKLPLELSCGLHLFMEIMNGKWKIDLIWSIHSGINRPAELHRQIARASRRLLDSHLSQLVSHGIINKKVYDQKTKKVEYSLTSLGETLIPVIEVAARWGETHREILEPLFVDVGHSTGS